MCLGCVPVHLAIHWVLSEAHDLRGGTETRHGYVFGRT